MGVVEWGEDIGKLQSRTAKKKYTTNSERCALFEVRPKKPVGRDIPGTPDGVKRKQMKIESLGIFQ